MQDNSLFELLDLIKCCKDRTLYVQTHNFPDPDAIASAFGFSKLMESFGVNTIICYEGRIDKLSSSKMLSTFGIKMHSYSEIKSTLTEEDYIICVDSQKNSGNTTDFIGTEVGCIDHHPTLVEVEYSIIKNVKITGACSTLIAEYYKRLGRIPECQVATALIYGIRMDTLQFSRGVTKLDIEMYGFLFPYCDNDILCRIERNNMEFSDLQAYGAAIENVKLYGYTGFSRIPFSCPDAMIAILSDFILSLVEVDVSVIYSIREDGIKLSVRSDRPEVHAGKITRNALFAIGDGGGHATMAGGLIPKENLSMLGNDPDVVIHDRFIKEINKESIT